LIVERQDELITAGLVTDEAILNHLDLLPAVWFTIFRFSHRA